MAINYYVVDTETTGLKSDYHEVTQISIIRCSDRKQLNKYIKAEFPNRATPQALEYTNRTIEDLNKGGTKKEAVDICNSFFDEDGGTPEERCIIGHNIVNFDKKFLYQLWQDCGYVFPANLWLDTLPYIKDFAKQRGLDAKKFTLNAALEIVGLKPKEGQHNAITDTQNNYLLWDKLKKEGIGHLPHMKRFAHSVG